LDLSHEKGLAGLHFGRGGFVIGWGAAADGGNKSIVEFEAIAQAGTLRLAGKASAMQGRVQKIAGGIAGEHAPGAVGTMGARGQANNEQAGLRVTKTGDGTPPVIPIAVGFAFEARHFLTPFCETRAKAAVGKRSIQLGPGLWD